MITEISGKKIDLAQVKARFEKPAEKNLRAVKLIAKEIPNFKENLLRQADEFMAGMMQFPGTGGVPIFVGNPPIWITDDMFRWFLSRGNQWVTMLQAYALTDERKYAKKVVDEFINWDEEVLKKLDDGMLLEKDNEFYAHGMHPLRLLEVGIHLYKTWPFIIRYLGNSDLLTEDVLGRYMYSVHLQSQIIHKYSPLFWPKADHNHYLMENLGMLTTALMFPEFPESKEWQETGVKELDRASKVQLTKEGGQIEGSASYHNGSMFWFGLLPILAKEYHFELPEGYLERYKKSLDYCLHIIRPNGCLAPFGDAHTTRVATDGMVYGYLVTGQTYWLRHALELFTQEEIISKAAAIIRYAGDPQQFIEMLKDLKKLEQKELLPTTFFNETLGQIFMRSSWIPNAQFVGMTSRSPVKNGHAHIDMLTFEYVAYGKNIITDPGIFTYKDGPDRRYFKSSLAHSTVVLNNQDFFEYVANFKFGPQKDAKLTHLLQDAISKTAIGYNFAYEPTKIFRSLTLVNDEFLVVIDKIKNRSEKDLVTRTFHLDYQQLTIFPNAVVAEDDQVNTKIVNYPQQNLTYKNGRLSDVNDTYRDSIELHYHDKSLVDTYVTVIYPFDSKVKDPEIKIALTKGKVLLTVHKMEYEISIENLEKLQVQKND